MDIAEVDNAIELVLRREFVRLGFYPDIEAFLASGDRAGFEAAKVALGDSVVEVYGVGGFKAREQLKHNDLIISRVGVRSGDTAYCSPIQFVDDGDGGFNKQRTVEGPSDIEYEVRVITDDVATDQMISQAMERVLGRRTWLMGVRATSPTEIEETEGFWLIRLGDPVDLSTTSIERMYRFLAKDLILADPVTIQSVPKITDIDIDAQPGV